MKTHNENQQPSGNGTDFVNHQSELDRAKNERIKSDKRTEKSEEDQVNRKENRTHKTGVSQKKTGGGKQISPGT